MMEENWINIEGDLLKISDLPEQIKELNLMPLFLRRYFERKFINDIQVNKEEQILFQQKFMQKEGIKNKDELYLKGSILICNPVPKKYSISNNIIEKAINSSMLKARQNKIHGKKLTPFLLEKVSSITKGKTLETNIQLMLNNAKLAARIAFALNK